MNNQNHFKENREQLMVLSVLITCLIPRSATNNKYAVWEETVPPLTGPPPHSHADEEVFYVLEGDFEFMLNGSLIPAQPGSVVHVPSNNVHNYKNTGQKTGKLLVMATTGLLVDYFRAIGQPVQSARDIPSMTIEPDFSKIDAEKAIALAAEYQVTFHL